MIMYNDIFYKSLLLAVLFSCYQLLQHYIGLGLGKYTSL